MAETLMAVTIDKSKAETLIPSSLKMAETLMAVTVDNVFTSSTY